MIPGIFTALYGVVDSMTTANGFNFDWRATKGDSRYFAESFRPSLNVKLETGAGNEYEESNAQGNDQYGIDERVIITGRIPVVDMDVDAEDVPYEAQLAQSKGFQDILHAYAVPGDYIGPVLTAGAVDMWYDSHEYIINEGAQRYNTMQVQVTFFVKYFMDRRV
mgnify:CR=1 FL=1